MDPDQTAPIGAVRSESTLFVVVDPDQIGAVRSESTLFVVKASKTFQQTTKAD